MRPTLFKTLLLALCISFSRATPQYPDLAEFFGECWKISTANIPKHKAIEMGMVFKKTKRIVQTHVDNANCDARHLANML